MRPCSCGGGDDEWGRANWQVHQARWAVLALLVVGALVMSVRYRAQLERTLFCLVAAAGAMAGYFMGWLEQRAESHSTGSAGGGGICVKPVDTAGARFWVVEAAEAETRLVQSGDFRRRIGWWGAMSS